MHDYVKPSNFATKRIFLNVGDLHVVLFIFAALGIRVRVNLKFVYSKRGLLGKFARLMSS